MGKVINLRTARKQKARAADRRRADDAAASTDGDAAETARQRAEAALEARRLEAHRRDGDEPDGAA